MLDQAAVRRAMRKDFAEATGRDSGQNAQAMDRGQDVGPSMFQILNLTEIRT